MANLKFKYIIDENLDIIKNNVNIETLLDELYSLQVIGVSEYENIKSKSTKDDKIDNFLKALSKSDKTGENYKSFMDVLQKHYNWIHDELVQVMDSDKWKTKQFQIALHYGDCPRKPAHYITRKDRIVQIQEKLRQMEIGHKIVLHGMTGCGKSSLAAGLLDQDLVLVTFAANVFWINVGKIDQDQLLQQMYRFYCKINTGNNKAIMPNTIEDMKLLLKKRILKGSTLNSYLLLILDNVYTSDVIEAFDLGCKILITTQNKSVIKNQTDVHFYDVNIPFTLTESLTLFQKCLGKPIEFIKTFPQAAEIHNLCKGYPMQIALIGSQMVTYREKMIHQKSQWDYYVNILRKKEFLDTQDSAIRACIESLDSGLRDKYEDFSIFLEDVNITSSVLETLWNLSKIKVEEIMVEELEKKSLIVPYYSTYHNTYIYGIHVVLLGYLKRSTSIDKTKRHRKLIAAYERICNSVYAKLPDDNYIFQYIGYHLQQAGMLEKFKIYYDLNFIGAKIRATGIGDLLKDFEIYEKEIIGDYNSSYIHPNNQILKELKTFVKNFGLELHKHHDIDIVQCGLKQPKDSYVFKAATEIAKKDTDSLYFKIRPYQKYFNNTFSLPEDSTVVCCAKNETEILIGMKNGDIKLWEQTYARTLCTFRGHEGSITYLEVDSERKVFLSICENGILHMWSLEDAAVRLNYESDIQKPVPLPQLKQEGYVNLFGSDIIIERNVQFKTKEKFILASFAGDYDDTKLIVSASEDYSIAVWKNDIKQNTYTIKRPIHCIKFAYDDMLILVSTENELYLLEVNFDQNKKFETIKGMIKAILVVEDGSFVTIYDKTLSIWNLTSKMMPGGIIPNLRETVFFELFNYSFICGNVFEEQYLYVFSTDGYIRMFDLKSMKLIGTHKEKNGCVHSIDILPCSSPEYGDYVFLHVYDNKKCRLSDTVLEIEDEISDNYLPIFDCYWPDNTHVKPRIAVVNNKQQIKILNGFNIFSEVDTTVPVKIVCFSSCGNKIAYGLENGDVIQCEIKTKVFHTVMKLHHPIIFLKYFDTSYGKNVHDFTGECKDFLVASAKNGTVMINNSGETVLLTSPCPASKKNVPLEPVKNCFYISHVQALFTVSDNRLIKVWYLNIDTSEVLKDCKISKDTFKVTMAALSTDQNWLALTMSNNIFEVYKVVIENGLLKLEDFGGKVLDCSLTCCCFSSDSRYLALGGEDGCVTIYDVARNRKTMILNLHKTAVKYLLFSPTPELILITVGEQIAWWNLNKFPKDLIKRSQRNLKRLSNEFSTSLSNLSLATMNTKWSTKIGMPNKPHLLRTIKLQGSHADYMKASPDFISFVTIDDSGKLYVIELFEYKLCDNKK